MTLVPAEVALAVEQIGVFADLAEVVVQAVGVLGQGKAYFEVMESVVGANLAADLADHWDLQVAGQVVVVAAAVCVAVEWAAEAF